MRVFVPAIVPKGIIARYCEETSPTMFGYIPAFMCGIRDRYIIASDGLSDVSSKRVSKRDGVYYGQVPLTTLIRLYGES